MQRLKAVRSKRVNLETSLSSMPSASSSPIKEIPATERAKSTKQPRVAMQPAGVTRPWAEPVKASTSSLQPQIGEFVVDEFARNLLHSINALKDRDLALFLRIMVQAVQKNDDKVRRADSLPNVNFAGVKQVIGMAHELPCDHIPFERPCQFAFKPEVGDGDVGELTGQSSGNTKSSDVGGSKKLCSGKMATPDESGITKVVQFAHEKLDSVHVKNRVFSELSFHFLVAGELELVLQENMSNEERWARLHFLRMLSYHCEYLDIEDIRDQYEATLKHIERGSHSWNDFKALEASMYTNLTFCTVKSRRGNR